MSSARATPTAEGRKHWSPKMPHRLPARNPESKGRGIEGKKPGEIVSQHRQA